MKRTTPFDPRKLVPGAATVLASLALLAGLGPSGPTRARAAEPAFLVRPYLQLPTPTSIRVMWETDQELPGAVEYGLTPALGRVQRVGIASRLHEVCLFDLQPATTYHYRVRSGGLVSEVYSFRTAPPRGAKRWRMAVYADSRSNPPVHAKVVEQIARQKVDLIVHCGDIVLNGKNYASWRTEFFEPLGALGRSVPWVSTIGNHEADSENYFSYVALPGNERYLAFDYASARIICLDSNGWIQKGRDSAQYRWLERQLRRPRDATWTFVAFHHPLFSAHATRPINPLRWDWAPLLLDPGNRVDGVLAGHDHFYARNWRMGPLGDRPQSGTLFLTSGGGAAGLYRSVTRDYVARQQSVHHFTLFDFDGDRVTLTAIDLTGREFDRATFTKEPTPPEEFCAYEVEELRQFLRLALNAAPAVRAVERGPTVIDTRLEVPTRFRVPVSGELVWKEAPGWKLKQPRGRFRLEPGRPLVIPLQAEVAAGPFPATPGLTIRFDPGRFRNRVIDVAPFKLAGPERLKAHPARRALRLDGSLADEAWQQAPGLALLGLPPKGGRADRVQVAVDADWLYVAARLDSPTGPVEVRPATEGGEGGRLVLFQEHVRVVLGNDKQTLTFALTPEQFRYSNPDPAADSVAWQGVAARQPEGWSAEVAIPRRLLAGVDDLRLNVVHHRREAKGFHDLELCPTFTLGTDPDRLPDWKPAEKVGQATRLDLD